VEKRAGRTQLFVEIIVISGSISTYSRGWGKPAHPAARGVVDALPAALVAALRRGGFQSHNRNTEKEEGRVTSQL
jgi:hypothetical protein